MEKNKSNSVTIRKSHIIYFFIALLLFLVGLFVGGVGIFNQTNPKSSDNCKKFCEFIPDTEFSHVSSDNHCYCLQKNQKLTDNLLNKTLLYTRIVDAGIIADVQINTK